MSYKLPGIGSHGLRTAKQRGLRRRTLLAAALFVFVFAARDSSAGESKWCAGCEFGVGAGNTYHYWGETGGLVVAATGIFDGGRYELGVFRMATKQTLLESGWYLPHVMAEPYWGFSASRRWQLFAKPAWRLFFGFGVSYKTEEDPLNSTHWNFASQLGIRLHHPSGQKPDVELCVRHWSNAGTRLPNRGQDFWTVALIF